MFDGGLDATTPSQRAPWHVRLHRHVPGQAGERPDDGHGHALAGIVVEELLRLGARRLIRVGTCGGIGRGIHTGDLVVATGAAPVDGATRTYLHGDPFAPVADFELTRGAGRRAQGGGRHSRRRPVATVDVFYNPDEDYVTKWRSRGILGVRDGGRRAVLPCGPRGAGSDVRAACILTVCDTLSEEETSEGTYLSLADLEAATDRMIEVALGQGSS